jgi:drug/metabolite transporter (DMT)-like permease
MSHQRRLRFLLMSTKSQRLRGARQVVSTPTHAYVNPVIALAHGWLLHGETVGASTVAAAGMVLGGVVAVAAVVR